MVFKKGHPYGKRFEKGLIPWNKNTKGLVKSNIGSFKKGLIPWNKGKRMSAKIKQKMSERYQYHTPTEKSLKNLKKGFTKESRSLLVFPVKDTSIEVKIQNLLKQLNIEYFTHQYIKEIEHGYQCDILIPVQQGITKKTIIECFGTYWHNYPYGREIDIKRCIELREKGFRVLVLWENEIKLMQLNNLQEVLIS